MLSFAKPSTKRVVDVESNPENTIRGSEQAACCTESAEAARAASKGKADSTDLAATCESVVRESVESVRSKRRN